MKKTRSLLAIWLALVLTLTLFPTALADADQNYTITADSGITLTSPASKTGTTDGSDLTISFTLADGYTNPQATYTVGGGEAQTVDSISESEGTYSFILANSLITGELKVTIQATAPYTITYVANDGTGASTTDPVPAGESVTLPTPTYADHTFLGWKVGNTEEILAAGATYTPSAAITLTAQWAENVTVTYDQGGDRSLTGTGYKGQTDYVAAEPTGTPEDQVFMGWQSSADNNIYQPGDKITLTAALTLTAQYADKVNITFASGTTASTSGIPAAEAGAAGAAYTLPTTTPRRTSGSYTFSGWTYSVDGALYQPGATVTLPADGSDVTFTANWAYTTYPDYDEDDSSSSSSSDEDEYTIRATATEGGYVSPSGTTTVDAGDDLTITFAPYSGYVIDAVYIDGVLDNSHDGSYTFRDVDEDHTFSVRYVLDSDASGSGSSDSSDSSPKTGDTRAPLSMGLGLSSLALAAFLLARKMRRA
ncbi:MAG: InlB B-repeat-containing protein [Candidatus Spyradocola sp.]|jgi:LPXTG-motif cell wall-anchored protein